MTDMNVMKLMEPVGGTIAGVKPKPGGLIRYDHYEDVQARVVLQERRVHVEFKATDGDMSCGVVTVVKSLDSVDMHGPEAAAISYASAGVPSVRFGLAVARALTIACAYAQDLDRRYPAGAPLS